MRKNGEFYGSMIAQGCSDCKNNNPRWDGSESKLKRCNLTAKVDPEKRIWVPCKILASSLKLIQKLPVLMMCIISYNHKEYVLGMKSETSKKPDIQSN